MVAIAKKKKKSSSSNDILFQAQSALRSVNAAAKATKCGEERRMFYEVKSTMLNHLILTQCRTNKVRVSGQFDRGRCYLIVTIETHQKTCCFHMPVEQLNPAARRVAADQLGDLARVYGVV